jgi:single-strand DNA-binding protein
MADINRVVLVGRLTRDAEVKYTASGKSVAHFSIAVNRRIRSGDDWKDVANFFDLLLWGHEGVCKYLTKGKQIAVDGELNQNRWEQDGKNRSRVEVIVNNIQLLDGRGQGTGPASGEPDLESYIAF